MADFLLNFKLVPTSFDYWNNEAEALVPKFCQQRLYYKINIQTQNHAEQFCTA